jgi:hypothetical protein
VRLDVMGRAMDAGVWQMWLALDEVCELVPFGPGFHGWAGEGAGEGARRHGADLVLLGDLTHSLPGLWDELWRDVAGCGVPSVMFVSDPGSAVQERIDALDRYRPSAILTLGYAPAYEQIDAAAQERGIRVLRRHLGYDPELFHPSPATERDIDVLVCGAAAANAYPVRRRIQSALRSMAPRRRVMDLTHPGYWETEGVDSGGVLSQVRVALRLLRDGGLPLLRSSLADRRAARRPGGGPSSRDFVPPPERHGQATFAQLARRARVVVTGTTFGIVSAKHYEVAACGAIGIGDMPRQEEAERFDSAMIVVGEDWDDARIVAAVDALLDDPQREAGTSRAALDAARGATHAERACETIRQLEELVPERPTTTREPAPGLAAWAGVIAGDVDDPERGRLDWADARARPLADLLAEVDAPVVVIASSAEAALPPDAEWLAAQVAAGAVLARRPMQSTGALDASGTWALCAVDASVLRAALVEAGSIELAIARIELEHGAAVAELSGFGDPHATRRQLAARRALEVPA